MPEVVFNICDDSIEYDYTFSQVEQEDEEMIDINKEEEEAEAAQANKKLYHLIVVVNYMLKRLPELYSGPMESLGGGRRDFSIQQEDIQHQDFSPIMSEALTQRIQLPPQQCPTLISKFVEAARAFSARPENSGLVEIPIKLSARVITVQKKGEDLQTTIARAVKRQRWIRICDHESFDTDHDGYTRKMNTNWRVFEVFQEMERRDLVLSKEEKLRLYNQIAREEGEDEAEAEAAQGGGGEALVVLSEEEKLRIYKRIAARHYKREAETAQGGAAAM